MFSSTMGSDEDFGIWYVIKWGGDMHIKDDLQGHGVRKLYDKDKYYILIQLKDDKPRTIIEFKNQFPRSLAIHKWMNGHVGHPRDIQVEENNNNNGTFW